eukprot:scaffold2369_cov359-Ochromonas_danica.AAC.1
MFFWEWFSSLPFFPSYHSSSKTIKECLETLLLVADLRRYNYLDCDGDQWYSSQQKGQKKGEHKQAYFVWKCERRGATWYWSQLQQGQASSTSSLQVSDA